MLNDLKKNKVLTPGEKSCWILNLVAIEKSRVNFTMWHSNFKWSPM